MCGLCIEQVTLFRVAKLVDLVLALALVVVVIGLEQCIGRTQRFFGTGLDQGGARGGLGGLGGGR